MWRSRLLYDLETHCHQGSCPRIQQDIECRAQTLIADDERRVIRDQPPVGGARVTQEATSAPIQTNSVLGCELTPTKPAQRLTETCSTHRTVTPDHNPSRLMVCSTQGANWFVIFHFSPYGIFGDFQAVRSHRMRCGPVC
jgi:hypothetical protein